jgi:Protein of unknown function (DUF3551)
VALTAAGASIANDALHFSNVMQRGRPQAASLILAAKAGNRRDGLNRSAQCLSAELCHLVDWGSVMKLSLTLLAVLAAAVAAGTRAQAQNYPWCAEYSGDMGGAMNCGFSTFAQCMENVSGIGGFCVANNVYRPPPGPAAPQPRKRHGTTRS